MQFDLFTYTNTSQLEERTDFFACTQGEDYAIWALVSCMNAHNMIEPATYQAATRTISFLSDLQMPGNSSPLENTPISGYGTGTQKRPNMTLSCVLCYQSSLRYHITGNNPFFYLHKGEIIASSDHLRSYEDQNYPISQNQVSQNAYSDVQGEPGSYPEITLQNGDAFLLCSDGFQNFITETEIELDRAKATSAQEWGITMLKRASMRALQKNQWKRFSLISVVINQKLEKI